MKFNEIPYSRPSHEELLVKIADFTQQLKEADSAEKQIQILNTSTVHCFFLKSVSSHLLP